jgi:hypothetical protein
MVTMKLELMHSCQIATGLLGFHDFNHFAAFVLPAARASAVCADFFMAIRTLRQLRDGQVVMSAARGSPALRMTAFGIRHGFLTFSILLQSLKFRFPL